MDKVKRFICLIFVALFMSDIASYIKTFVEHKDISFHRFMVFSTHFSDHIVVFNLSIIYFIGVSVLYFLFNFFKKKD